MKALDKEQLIMVERLAVDVGLYTHDIMAAATASEDYSPSMLLMDVEQLRESQRALGVVYADDESLDYWEAKARGDITNEKQQG